MSEPTSPAAPESKPAAPRRRRGRRWLIGIGVVLLILIALVLFAPTIASTSPVRQFVVGKINNQLNGRVEIDDWSLGWNQGITARGIQVYGPNNELILEVPKVVTELTLLEAARGNFDIGETQVDVNLTQVIIDENGESNYQKLVKTSSDAEPKPTTEPAPLPDVRGKVTINIKGGTIAGPGVAAPVHLQPGSIVANIPSINGAIENQVDLSYRVGSADSLSSIKASGTVDLFENNQPALASMKLNQKLELQQVDLAAIAPFIQSKDQNAAPIRLEGILNGALNVDAAGLADATAAGNIVIANFIFAGGPLKGDDVFKTQQITIPVQVTQSGEGDAAILNIEKLAIEMPEGSISVTGTVAQQAITNVLANKPPGHEGQITALTNIPKLAEIANQLDDTLGLGQDVQINTGSLTQTSTIHFTTQQTKVTQHTELAASGKRGDQQIELSPIVLDAGAAIVPGASEQPEFRDLNIKLVSSFATINGEGDSLANLHVHGNADLDRLNQELRQFSDLGGASFAGRSEFDVSTKGDLADQTRPIDVALRADVQGLHVSLPQQKLELSAGGVDVQTSAAYASRTISISQSKPLVLDLAQLTAQSEGKPILRDETVHLALAGDVTMAEALTTAKLSQLELTTSSNLIKLQKSERELVLTIPAGGAVTGQGQVNIIADLPRLNQIAGAFGGEPLLADLTGGQLAGTIDLAQVQGGDSTVIASLDVQQLTVGNYLQNEKVDIDLRGQFPADLSSLQASADVNSAFATIKLSDATLLFTQKDQDEALDKLQQAKLVVNVPNLPKVYALIDAMQPPAPEQPSAEPAPPLQVLQGSAVATIDVAQKSGATQIDVSELRVSQLALARGNTTYQMPRDLNVKLTAAMGETEIRVAALSGDLGIAQLSMPQPIILRNLGSEQLTAEGAVKLEGELDAGLPLVAVLQGAAEKYPYHGTYSITQNVATNAGQVALKGDVAVENFRVIENEQELFAEPRIEIVNDIALEPETENLLINSLRVSMPKSQAIQVSANGQIHQLSTQRKLENVVLALDYDLEKLLPILKPMLGPDFADLQLAGKYSQQFKVSGSYPAKDESGNQLAFNESIRSLKASGAVGIGLLDWQGAHLENYLLPIDLKDGKLATIYADKPKDQSHPAPGSFNGGTIDLGGMVVDLTHETPRLSIGKNQKLLSQVSLNPLLADNVLGKFVNPAFVDPNEARGLVDVIVVQCENLALGQGITSADSGRAQIDLSITGVTLGNELITKIVTVIKPGAFNQNFLSGDIRNAKIIIENGKLSQDLAIVVNDKYPLRFDGAVRLADQKLDPMFITVPAELLARIQENWLKYLPEGIRVPIRGTTTKWNLPIAEAVSSTVQDVAKRAVLEELTGGLGGRRAEPPPREAQPGEPAPATSPSARPPEKDLGGTLIDIFQQQIDRDKERKEKRKQ